MSAVSLSIIVATTGRTTLGAAVESATSQMQPGDELIVVFDDSGDFGDTPRNQILDGMVGTHLSMLDDDDEFVPGALDTIRRFAEVHPNSVGIFQQDFGVWGILWRDQNLLATATGMYVVPNVAGKVGRFGRLPGTEPGKMGDYKFIVETVALQGDPVWCPHVIQMVKPEHNRLKRLRYRLRLRTRALSILGRPERSRKPPLRSYPEAEEWAWRVLAEAGRSVAASPTAAAGTGHLGAAAKGQRDPEFVAD